MALPKMVLVQTVGDVRRGYVVGLDQVRLGTLVV